MKDDKVAADPKLVSADTWKQYEEGLAGEKQDEWMANMDGDTYETNGHKNRKRYR